jgi:hypothetical protein
MDSFTSYTTNNYKSDSISSYTTNNSKSNSISSYAIKGELYIYNCDIDDYQKKFLNVVGITTKISVQINDLFEKLTLFVENKDYDQLLSVIKQLYSFYSNKHIVLKIVDKLKILKIISSNEPHLEKVYFVIDLDQKDIYHPDTEIIRSLLYQLICLCKIEN